ALACSGWIAVDGVRHQLAGAPAVHKHIWGTRRVEELLWLHCPRFAEDPTATVEATAVRLRRRIAGRIESPWVTPVWARTADGVVDGCSLWRSLKNHVERRGTYDVVFHAGTPRHWVRAHASCDPATLAGWVYRDPAGWDVHVAQSDVATCTLELLERPHPLAPWTPVRRLVAPEGAALEFHAPEPLPGVTYAGWD